MENQTLVTEICPTTTQKWIAEGATLVDVREKKKSRNFDSSLKILYTSLNLKIRRCFFSKNEN